MRKVCECCKQNRKLEFFTVGRSICKQCYAGKERIRRECGNNAAISKLLRWPAIFLVIVGVLRYDFVDGSSRTCVYETIRGMHAVTIDAMRMCPMTWEFDE